MKHAHRGEIVYDVADPRHVGIIEGTNWNGQQLFCRIRWLDTGFKSFHVPVEDLRLVHPGKPVKHSVSQLMNRLRENQK